MSQETVDLEYNPFMIAYNALWDLVDSNASIDRLVRTKNKIKFDTIQGRKEQAVDSDFPELSLSPLGGVTGLCHNSSGTRCIRQYTWGVTTKDVRLKHEFNPLIWQLFISMAQWQSGFANFLWNDKSFIRELALVDETSSDLGLLEEKGIRGWSGLMTVELHFFFSKTDLLAEYQSI